jgi:cytochrome c oxidase cbb3-type subunit II
MKEIKEQSKVSGMKASFVHFMHSFEKSTLLLIIGIVVLFSTSISVILIAPRYIDTTWTSPSSPYQVQMYEIADPNFYMSSASSGGKELQYVHHLKNHFTLLAFKESENIRFVAPEELKKYITEYKHHDLRLTSRLLLLRDPEGTMIEEADKLQKTLQVGNDKKENEKEKDSDKKKEKIAFQILELYDPKVEEAFSIDLSGGILQDWVDTNFTILDDHIEQMYHKDYGVIYVQNPKEFRIIPLKQGGIERWRYDTKGRAIKNLEELTNHTLGFYSRKELIEVGENIYAIEGCWYCHTDQTRTLIEDVVVNGSDSYPAPPSSANEFIYQKITFPGTRRIGPDLSRVGVKKPSRDWHMSHFWAPKTASEGSIMPAFQHFFDNDPRGTAKSAIGIPNYRFEAIYQYMMTKGTRITAPTQAWWLGKDPIQTKEIIQGQRKLQ